MVLSCQLHNMTKCMIRMFLLLFSFFSATSHCPAVVRIVAVENFYGEIARRIGGTSVEVTNILRNPNQNPHEFQIDAATVKAIADADILIYNGLGYDDWVEKLLKTDGTTAHCVAIKVADLVGAKVGQNPHIWYHPNTMSALVVKLAHILNKHGAVGDFENIMQPLREKIKTLRKKTFGLKVTATESIFGYMAYSLGWEMLNYNYQHTAVNNAEPCFQQSVDFEKALNGQVRILFYNSQVQNPSAKRMQAIAKKHGVAVVGIAETQPQHIPNYVDWMLRELSMVEKVLGLR